MGLQPEPLQFVVCRYYKPGDVTVGGPEVARNVQEMVDSQPQGSVLVMVLRSSLVLLQPCTDGTRNPAAMFTRSAEALARVLSLGPARAFISRLQTLTPLRLTV